MLPRLFEKFVEKHDIDSEIYEILGFYDHEDFGRNNLYQFHYIYLEADQYFDPYYIIECETVDENSFKQPIDIEAMKFETIELGIKRKAPAEDEIITIDQILENRAIVTDFMIDIEDIVLADSERYIIERLLKIKLQVEDTIMNELKDCLQLLTSVKQHNCEMDPTANDYLTSAWIFSLNKIDPARKVSCKYKRSLLGLPVDDCG